MVTVTDENMTRTGAEKEWGQAWQSTFATAFLPSLRACCLAPRYHGLGRYGSHGGRMWQQKGKGADEPADVMSSCTTVPKFGTI
jgi:hypothetical protein